MAYKLINSHVKQTRQRSNSAVSIFKCLEDENSPCLRPVIWSCGLGRLSLFESLKTGLTDVNTEDIFTVCANNSRRVHGHKLYMPYSKSTARYSYFSNRVDGMWNALPCDEVDFSPLRRFRNSLTAKVLVRYCSLNNLFRSDTLLMCHCVSLYFIVFLCFCITS